MADGIHYLQSVSALQASEAADDLSDQAVIAPVEKPPAQPGISAKPVLGLIDDLLKVAKVDGKDGHLVDAVIEKFCDDQFSLDAKQGERVEAMLKIAVHSAMEGGLTRSEAIAAISQVGDTVKTSNALPAEAFVEASKIAGKDAHLSMGLGHFMVEMDGGHPVVPAAEPAGMRSEIEARHDSFFNGIAQNFR